MKRRALLMASLGLIGTAALATAAVCLTSGCSSVGYCVSTLTNLLKNRCAMSPCRPA